MNLIKFNGVYKDYIWGGTKLNSKYSKNSGFEKTAESWELSVHPDGESVISGGVYDGMCLSEYIKQNPSVLGTSRKTDELPILIKLIDAEDNLSVQVHPDDEMSKKFENQKGKTEMWYVVEADSDAKIVFGVQEYITKDELKNAILSNTVEDLLNSVPSKKGDVFFVEAGTIHAIGKGNLIAEIQQNSNVTYRLYDYDRRDRYGNSRELHIEKGVMASITQKQEKRIIPRCSDGTRLIASCEHFVVKELFVKEASQMVCRKESYQALICVDGKIEISNECETKNLNVGETAFIPAGFGEYTLKGIGTILITENPPKYFSIICFIKTNISSAVIDEFGNIYGRAIRKNVIPRPYNEIFDDMALCAKEAAYNSGIKWENIESVSIDSPGSISNNTSNNQFLKSVDCHDVYLTDYMENTLDKKIFIEDDGDYTAWMNMFQGETKIRIV